MEKGTRVCHFTSAHDPLDDRIFLKECISLAEAGYHVCLVAKGKSFDEKGVHIVGCGMPKGRMGRMLFFSRRVYKKARELDCEVYHFHDPELLPYGLKLKRQGKKVIFDSHEDVPAQILDKYWIPKAVRGVLSSFYKLYETYVVKRIDAVITATDHIAGCFRGRAKKIVVINNYPKLDDIVFHETPFNERENVICYAGGISEIRGEKVMIEAIKGIDADLLMAGAHEVISIPNGGKYKVRFLGQISREDVNKLYGKSKVGLLLYQPAKNHFEAQPIKIFEYMAAGLPFIASDFPLWRQIAETDACGLCVNCESPQEVGNAIRYLIENGDEAQKMGKRGREAVVSRYNWNIERGKLLSLYEET